MKYRRYAAIDIGSNAMRLLICGVFRKKKKQRVKKVALVRLPVRLGVEAFLEGEISLPTQDRFLDGMKAYRHIMKVHGISDFRACATSAMRDASNGRELAQKVRDITGIEIDIIDGKTEADYIFNGHFQNKLDPDCNYVYVDVGGGSTEITILSDREVVTSESFGIGTLRLLNNTVNEGDWKNLKNWIKEKTAELDHVEMIGSGGNINKIYKLSKKKYPRPMLYNEFKKMRSKLSKYTVEERMSRFSLNPDRADVIVHASDIYYKAMKWSDCSILHVPKIGLSDGIIMRMINEDNALN